MLETIDQRGGNHQANQQPDQVAHEFTRAHAVDHLTDQERLRQGCGSTNHAEHNDEGENLLVFKQVGHELPKACFGCGGGIFRGRRTTTHAG